MKLMAVFSSIALLVTCLTPAPRAAGAVADTNRIADIRRRVEAAPAHPRLFWPAGGEKALLAKVADDPLLKKTFDAVRLCADHMLSEPAVEYRKEGRRLLGRSREALARVMHLSFLFRLTGDTRYADRAIVEMKAAAAMPDWNPSHFLDTAEMTLALAVGYDWLHARLTPEQRAGIRTAIVDKGLTPYLKAGARHGWERGGNNWNQVCHAGMTAGALALLEDDPARAAEVVERALNGLPSAMKVYKPDGTYPEGPSYWNYGTTFNVLIVNMLETALGTDFGLSQAEGFLKTGEFPLHMMGPTLRYYPFSDCGTGSGSSPAMFWFAARTKRPELLWFERSLLQRDADETIRGGGADSPDRFFPLTLVWAQARDDRREPAIRNWLGRGPNPLAVFRSSFSDPNAVYLAVKAGSPGASHGHMDIGSFVLDADGERWSLDLGMQNYHRMEERGLDIWNNRPGSDRWRIFRYHNRAHSTLMVDDQEQVVSSQAPISDFSGEPGRAFTVVDMNQTYRGQLDAVSRRFRLMPDNRVVVEDRLKGGATNAVVRWAMVTPATVKSDRTGSAWLEQNGKRMRLDVLRPAGAEINVWPADPPPRDFDEPNPGVRIVGFECKIAAGQAADFQVVLTPGMAWKESLPKVDDLPWPNAQR